MDLSKFIGFRLKDVLDELKELEKCGINKYSFEITKEPRGEKREITENCRVLRVTKINGTVNILVCYAE